MLARSEFYIKWALYALTGLVVWMVQGAVLQRIWIMGVIAFLYPLPTAMVGILEGPFSGTVYGLIAGILCDQIVVAPIPCLYTLLFPLVGLLSGLIGGYGLKGGILCALVCTLTASALTGAGTALVLFLDGKLTPSLWEIAGLLLAKETGVTLPFAIPTYLLFCAAHRRVHRFD